MEIVGNIVWKFVGDWESDLDRGERVENLIECVEVPGRLLISTQFSLISITMPPPVKPLFYGVIIVIMERF